MTSRRPSAVEIRKYPILATSHAKVTMEAESCQGRDHPMNTGMAASSQPRQPGKLYQSRDRRHEFYELDYRNKC